MTNKPVTGLENYRRRVSAQKRKDIIGAAICEFGLQGFEKGAMAEIAHQADVSTATLYKHFGSKHDLFNAVCDAVNNRDGELGANIYVARAALLSMSDFAKHGSPAVKRGIAVMEDVIKAMQNALLKEKETAKKKERAFA